MVEGSSDLRRILEEFVARLKTSPLWLDVTSSIVNGLSGSQRPAAEMLDMLEQVVALRPSQWLGFVSARPSWSEADLSYLLHAAVRLHAFQPPFLFLSRLEACLPFENTPRAKGISISVFFASFVIQRAKDLEFKAGDETLASGDTFGPAGFFRESCTYL